MNINGRFSLCTDPANKTAPVVVGFHGVYPHDLTPAQLRHIKTFYNRTGWDHRYSFEWPAEFTPAFPAAAKNFNSYMIIELPSDNPANQTNL